MRYVDYFCRPYVLFVDKRKNHMLLRLPWDCNMFYINIGYPISLLERYREVIDFSANFPTEVNPCS